MLSGGGIGSGVGAGGSGCGSRSGCGSGTGGIGVSTSSSQVGTCSTVDSCGSSAGGCSGAAGGARCRGAASVALKSSASGPSRMLARFRAIEHLLRELAIEVGGVTGRVVAENGLSLHGRLRIAHGLADLRLEHEVSEVLLEDVDRFLRVQQALVEHRRQDPLDLHVRVQVLA